MATVSILTPLRPFLRLVVFCSFLARQTPASRVVDSSSPPLYTAQTEAPTRSETHSSKSISPVRNFKYVLCLGMFGTKYVNIYCVCVCVLLKYLVDIVVYCAWVYSTLQICIVCIVFVYVHKL